MTTSPTSYLQSERHFRLYEPYLAEIVRRWPLATIFTPTPPVASVETLSSRIRIAKDALRKNIQSSEETWQTEIPIHTFLQVVDELVVSTTAKPGFVVCGPMDVVLDIKRKSGVSRDVLCEPVVEQLVPKVNLIDPDLELILAVLTLHHYRLLSEPSVITTNKYHEEIRAFAESHDIAITNDRDTFTII